jgi:hypothetical protein
MNHENWVLVNLLDVHEQLGIDISSECGDHWCRTTTVSNTHELALQFHWTT